MPRIACLHTAESNIPVFDAALSSLGLIDVELHHHVRADLLAAAERSGELTEEVAAQTGEVLRDLCVEADAVLLTCSTLGPAAETVAEYAPIPVLRVDAALAREAVKNGGVVVVLCAVDTTMEPTGRLFEKAAQATRAEVSMKLVPHAWRAFRAGNRERYLEMIARSAEEAVRAGATQVVLAQASMADAANLVSACRPLASPAAGLAAAHAATLRAADRQLIRDTAEFAAGKTKATP